jgi:uncharacterized protein (TIGR03066 family)
MSQQAAGRIVLPAVPSPPALIPHKEKGMTVLRAALVGCLLLAVASVGLAQKGKSKIDKSKLVGKWTFVKTDSIKPPPKGAEMTVEFTKDGKVTMTFKLEDKTNSAGGTYSVKGDQLTTILKLGGGQERKETVTIKELTDKKFVTTEKEGDKTVTSEFKKS